MYPQGVRKNYRFRGPIESLKLNENNLDIVKNLYDLQLAQNENMSVLKGIRDEVFVSIYDNQEISSTKIHDRIKEASKGVYGNG